METVCNGDFLGCDSNSTLVRAESLCALLQIPDLNTMDQFTLLDGAGLNAATLVNEMEAVMDEGISYAVDSLYPMDDYMLVVPMAVGIAMALLTTLYLAMSYLPSIAATTIQLRTGVIPTLSEKKLNLYRAAVSDVTQRVIIRHVFQSISNHEHARPNSPTLSRC